MIEDGETEDRHVEMLRTYAQVLQRMAFELPAADSERRSALSLAAAMMETLADDDLPGWLRMH